MRTITRLGAAVVMASFVAACSGGGGGRVTPGVLTTVPTIPNSITSPAPIAPAAAVPVTLTIPVPGRAPSGHSRIPDYVSVNTKGASFTVGQLKGTTMSTIAANAAACTTTCATTTNLLPGSYFVTISLFDTKPAGSTLPATAKRLSTGSTQLVITAGASNVFKLVLAGDVAKIKTTITPTSIKKGSGVKPQTIVQAFDPSGALIVGTLDKKIKTSAKGKSGKVGLSIMRAVALDDRSVFAGARVPLDTPAPVPTNSDGSADITNAGQPETLDIPATDSDPSICVEAQDDGAAPAATPDPNATQDPTAQSVARKPSYLAPTPTPAPDPNSGEGTDAPSTACVTIAGGDPQLDPPGDGAPDVVGGNANGTPRTTPTTAPSAGTPFTPSTPTPVTSPLAIATAAPGVVVMQSFGIANALYAAINGNTGSQAIALFSPLDASNVGPNPLIAGTVDVNGAPQNGTPASTFAKQRSVSSMLRHPSRVSRPMRVAKQLRTPFHVFRSATIGAKNFRRVRNSPPNFPALGATQKFFLAGASSTSSTVPAAVVAQDTTASRFEVYATTGATADGLTSAAATQIQQMVANADTVVTGLLGDATAWSSTNAAAATNPQYVSVVVYDQNTDVNTNSDVNIPSTLGTAIGFFNPTDLYTSSLVGTSPTNAAPVIFVSWNGQTDPVSMANLQGAITREYSNLALYVFNNLTGNASTDAPAWIVAGIGGIADDYTSSTTVAPGTAATAPSPASAGGGNGAQSVSSPVYDVDNSLQFVQTYLYNPSSYSLTAFAGISDQDGTYHQNLPGNYGVSYLFFKFFTDRLGLSFISNLVTGSNAGNLSTAAVVAAANAAGASYPTTTVSGAGPASTDGFTAMMQDFVTAQAAALAGADTTTVPTQMQSFSLGNPNSPAILSSPVTGTMATLAGPNPTGAVAITDTGAGSPPTFPLFPSSAVFFGVDAAGTSKGILDATNGNAVRADDLVSGGLNLQGILVQTGAALTPSSVRRTH